MMGIYFKKTDPIEMELRNIKQSVHLLIGLLPDEQKHKGSELQQIDALVNTLYYRYVKDDERRNT